MQLLGGGGGGVLKHFWFCFAFAVLLVGGDVQNAIYCFCDNNYSLLLYMLHFTFLLIMRYSQR